MSVAPSVYTHLSPGRMVFGPGSLAQLPGLLDLSQRHLVVTDPGLVKAGVVEKVIAALEEGGVDFVIYDRTPADPPVEACEEAYALAKEKDCQAVIGLGGGSSIDAAKGVAARMAHPDVSLVEMGNGKDVTGSMPPLYAIPTTAGTGSEATRVAVITDSDAGVKMAIRGECLAPLAGILDPNLLTGLPSKIMAETGADALTHAVEAATSRMANAYTDSLAMAAIGMVGANLRQAVADPENDLAVGNMLMASCLAGQAFSNAGLGLAHSMAEPLGAAFHVSHGLGCAIFLPQIMNFNLIAAPDKFSRIAEALGEDLDGKPSHMTAQLAVDAVIELFLDVGVPLTYAQAGIDFELNDKMIDDVPGQYSSFCNPRRASRQQIAELYMGPVAPEMG